MPLLVLGINHHSAPLEVREKLAFPPETQADALNALASRPGVAEAVLVSTCNRTEVYCNTDEPDAAIDWLANYHRLQAANLEPYVYRLPSERAVKHAFRVASGLDSMVLGEAQILGQMKDAVKSAEQAGTLGLLLHKLFQRTFSVAKEVRSQTEIGANSVSMAAAAVRLAARIFESIAEQSVLFIGAGEMIELCAAHFCAQRPRRVTVANRTVERARALAHHYEGQAITLNELPEQLALHDIVVTCTASPLPILGKGMLERAIKARRHRPIFIVDLAVPRDVEPEVADMNDIFLYTVDDLAEIVRDGVEARQGAVAQAEAIIESRVRDFEEWIKARRAVPVIQDLRTRADALRRRELDRALKQLARGDTPEAVIEQLSQALTNKFLHDPMSTLRDAGDEAEAARVQALLARFYSSDH